MFRPVKEDFAAVAALSVAQIARAVPTGGRLQIADAAWDELRNRRQAHLNEQNRLATLFRADSTTISVEIVNAFDVQIRELETQITAARKTAMTLRRARSVVVAQALASTRANAASKFLAAAEALMANAEILGECADAVRTAGDSDQPFFYAPVLDQTLIKHAERVARGIT